MFRCGVAVHPGGEQDMSSILDQGDKADLGIARGTPGTGWLAECCRIGRGIGHIQRAAVQTDEPPLPIPCSLRPGGGERSDNLVMQLLQWLRSNPLARL